MTHLGPFRLDARLGAGAVGEVWRAVHEATGETVAVKVLRPEHADRWRRLMRREVEAVARLDHPGVVWIHDHGEDPRLGPWLALELASGGTLADRLPVASWSVLWSLLEELLPALAHAHARGVLHRDLKPANVLLCTLDDPRPGAKLADFSLASVGAARGVAGGTPDFVAPEQRGGRFAEEGPWTDLFALGGLVWSAACGGPPTTTPWRPVFSVPPGLREWVDALRAPSPRARPASAAAARAALRGVGDAPEGPGPALPTFETSGAPLRRHPRRSPASLGLFGIRPTPITGRSREQAALAERVAAAVAGRGPVVARLVGDRGLGKTRLLDGLEVAVRESDAATVLRLSGEAFASSVLRRWPEGLRVAGLRGAERSDWLREAGHAPADRIEAWLDGADDDAGDVLLAWAATHPRPVLVLVDDLVRGGEAERWMTTAAASGVRHLVIVGAARHAAPHPGVEDLVVARIAEPAGVARALGIGDPGLAHAIGARSGGSPALVVGLVRALVHAGQLVAGPRGWVLTPGASLAVPTDLGLATSVDPADLAALEILAALGPIATRPLWLLACARCEVPWSEARAESLRRAGLVQGDDEPRPADPALAAQLLEASRAAGTLSGRAATLAALVATTTEPGPERDEQLGQLWFDAGRFREAGPLLFLASRDPRHSDDEDRTHALLDRVLAAYDALPDDDEAREGREKAHLWRAGVWGNWGHLDRALAALDAQRPVHPWSVWRHTLMLAEMRMRAGRVRAALAPARAAVATAPGAREVEQASTVLGRLLLELGETEEALRVLGPLETPLAVMERASAWVARGALDEAERELDRVPEPPVRLAGAWTLTRLYVRLARGEPTYDDVTALLRGPRVAVDPHLRVGAAALRVLAGIREGRGEPGAHEAEAREAIACSGTRARYVREALADAAQAAPPEVAGRLWDLVRQLEPLDGPD